MFAFSDKDLGRTDVVEHGIDTGGHPPIRQQPYWVPVVNRQKIPQMISDMQDQGVSPVVLVP